MSVQSTWNERELPVLEAVYAAEERGERPGPEELATATGMNVDLVMRVVGPLVDSQHLDGVDATTMADMFPSYMALRLLERGRRAIGQWPPGPADAFLEGINRLIAAETDPVERSRLVKLRDSAADVAKQALAGAIVAAGAAGLT